MVLTPTMEKYILHWGEMGTRWGVNRSVAQVHALLYLSENPLSADEIADSLTMARSNVSTSLKELQSWNLISRTHVLGDRRDHFVAQEDLWEVLMAIARGRKSREIDPTLTVLRQCVNESDADTQMPDIAKQRIVKMLAFIEILVNWYDQMNRLPKSVLIKLMKMGDKVARVIPKGKDIADKGDRR